MYKNFVKKIENSQLRNDLSKLNTGYFVKINFCINKNNQSFSGIIICKKNKNLLSSIIIRKILSGEGVEKTFYIHSPNIISIEIYKKIKTKKSKLYFIRKNKKFCKY